MRTEVWFTDRRGQILALTIGLLATVLIWFGVVHPFCSWFTDRQILVKQRQALLYKMRSVAATPTFFHTVSEKKKEGGEETLMLGSTTDAIAAADLQERIQKIAEACGASLTSVETLLVTPEAGLWHRISLRISLDTSWPSLVELIRSVEQSPTLILVDDVRFHRSGPLTQPDPLRIQASMMLYGFRAVETSSQIKRLRLD